MSFIIQSAVAGLHADADDGRGTQNKVFPFKIADGHIDKGIDTRAIQHAGIPLLEGIQGWEHHRFTLTTAEVEVDGEPPGRPGHAGTTERPVKPTQDAPWLRGGARTVGLHPQLALNLRLIVRRW